MREFILELLTENKELKAYNKEITMEYEEKSIRNNELVFENTELKQKLKQSKDDYACMESSYIIHEDKLEKQIKALKNELAIYKGEYNKLKKAAPTAQETKRRGRPKKTK